jgi:hypothetical protein
MDIYALAIDHNIYKIENLSYYAIRRIMTTSITSMCADLCRSTITYFTVNYWIYRKGTQESYLLILQIVNDQAMHMIRMHSIRH